MNKEEVRARLNSSNKVGSREIEAKQIHKLQTEQNPNEISTITVNCYNVLTIICC